jgi:division protein CdvB (Snf7/Vps24/ESCRT-III family)
MSKKFVKSWEKTQGKGVPTRIKETIRPPGPIKPRVDKAVRALEMQLQRLDQIGNRLGERDKAIFGRVVSSLSKHDTAHATVFANELAEIRKMSKMILQSRLALEQVVLRLRTVQELGDVVVSLAPALSVIQGIRTGISGVLPEAEQELSNIGTMLNSMLFEAGSTSGMTLDFGSANEDAQKILSEAAAVAEQQMKSRFPELPAAAGIAESQTEKQ